MRKLVALTFLTLDGVMQAPGATGEDPSGGFRHEGWLPPLFDEALAVEMGVQMAPPFDLLLGRKTYDIFAAYWPHHDSPINAARKYVATRGEIDTGWHETIPIRGDVVSAIRDLKQHDGPVLQVHGSGNLLQTLLGHDLVDELWLKTFPIVLGEGKKLFGDGIAPAAFRLDTVTTTSTGVIVARYSRNGEVTLGSVP